MVWQVYAVVRKTLLYLLSSLPWMKRFGAITKYRNLLASIKAKAEGFFVVGHAHYLLPKGRHDRAQA